MSDDASRKQFEQRFLERRGLAPNDSKIMECFGRYNFDCYISSLVYKGDPPLASSKAVQWLKEVKEAAEKLALLLDPRRFGRVETDEKSAHDMLINTFVAGIMISPLHEMQTAGLIDVPDPESWQELMEQAPASFNFGLDIGHPFLQILIDLATNPIFPDQSYKYFSRVRQAQGKEPLPDNPLPPGAATDNQGPSIQVQRVADSQLSLEKALKRASQMLCTRLHSILANHGKQARIYNDMIDLIGYHKAAVDGIYPRGRTKEAVIVNRIKQWVSRGRKFIKDQKGQDSFLGWTASISMDDLPKKLGNLADRDKES